MRRAPNGQFVEGTAPGPGKPPWGRKACLTTLENLLADAKNQEALRADLQAVFDRGPAKFLLRFVYPLLPRDMFKVDIGDSGVSIKIIGNVTEGRL